MIKEKRRKLRERLVATGGVGPYPRALCASWDIHARKTLAGMPAEAENGSIAVFDSREKLVSDCCGIWMLMRWVLMPCDSHFYSRKNGRRQFAAYGRLSGLVC